MAELDENIIVNIDCLHNLVREVHKQSCSKPCVKVAVTKRAGLCVTVQMKCSSCKYQAPPVNLTDTMKKSRGPAAGVLNDMLVLPVLKSKLGLMDVSLVLSLLKHKASNSSIATEEIKQHV
jgi:hypothetical protein